MKAENWSNVVGGFISWVMDGYDLGAVVITSSILGILFYPTLKLLGSVLPIVFTIMSRPIGGFVFGYIGDKLGRRSSLLVTVLGYSLSIGLTAILPTYAQIGVLASIFLSLLRFLQGIFIGGDVAGSFTIVMESINSYRGIFSGLMQSGVLIGFVGVDSLFTYLASTTGRDFISFYWKLIFIIGVIPAILAVLIRFKMSEPSVWANIKHDINPLRGLRQLPQPLLVMIGFWLAIYAGPQLVPTIFGQVMKLSPSYYGYLVIYMNLIGIASMLISGLFSDFIGRKKMGILGIVLSIIGGVIFYHFLPVYRNLLYLTLLFGFLVNLPSAITPAFLSERFKTYARALGIGTAYNGAYIIAGWAPLLVSALSQFMSPFNSATIIFALGNLIALISLAVGPETYKVSLG
ncbi:MFS transporter [Sulfolobus sp. A20]|uniref:MFS transporter n=2 Tax=Sulfolobaceae TaxID=118883 RepID=UPI000845ED35|nr:MFS transporter [Sulfolobus sp. A20]TRM78703.1 MFS transporter [Sulfolobus sp. A20-N-F8]TRM81796.1 MFS transporter [Sulfolobus sp. D5]TRM87888.1 MFS transporter [Sulfolobus sp. C3]TRM95556.1 MFS transporter [Sulfolobus sp. A20-N-G8]TRN02605.1 MFS transporter [Sulfolobus sp. F1]